MNSRKSRVRSDSSATSLNASSTSNCDRHCTQNIQGSTSSLWGRCGNKQLAHKADTIVQCKKVTLWHRFQDTPGHTTPLHARSMLLPYLLPSRVRVQRRCSHLQHRLERGLALAYLTLLHLGKFTLPCLCLFEELSQENKANSNMARDRSTSSFPVGLGPSIALNSSPIKLELRIKRECKRVNNGYISLSRIHRETYSDEVSIPCSSQH